MGNYRHDIEGLRGLAVLSVIFFHLQIFNVNAGYLGVDIFFVISGYVVTKSINGSVSLGNFSFIEFYKRRAKRLLPALYVMLLMITALSLFILKPNDLKVYFETLIGTLLFSANILLYFDSGYFQEISEYNPLLHMWSLSVEEQFYLLFPFFYIVIIANRTSKQKLIVLSIVCILTFYISNYFANRSPSFAFYMMPFRIWELFIGSAAYFLYETKYIKNYFNRRSRSIIRDMAFFLLIISLFYPIPNFTSPGVGSIISVISVTILLLFRANTSISDFVLTNKIILRMGLISYSLYIWHQPILALSKNVKSDLFISDKFFIFLFIFCFANLSYELVEKKFNKKEKNDVIIKLIILTSLIIFGIATTFLINKNYEQFWRNTADQSTLAVYDVLQDRDYLRVGDIDRVNSYTLNGHCKFISTNSDQEFQKRFDECFHSNGRGHLIIGDSHAMNMFNGLAYNLPENMFVFAIARPRCRPADLDCHFDISSDFILENKEKIKNIYYTQSGRYMLKVNGGNPDRKLFSSDRLLSNSNIFTYDEFQINSVFEYISKLQKLVPGKISFYGPRIEPHITDIEIYKFGCGHTEYLHSVIKNIFIKLDKELGIRSKKYNIKYISQNEDLKLDFQKDFMSCKSIFWADGDHFNTIGEKIFFSRSELNHIITGKD